MGTNNARWISVIVVWFILLALGMAIIFKFILKPTEIKKIENLTSAKSQYDDVITINLDSFSGYCLLRTEFFKEELKAEGIRLNLNDDHADYYQRIRDLQQDKCQFAVFTVDSLILSSTDLGQWPATIILMIDESHGADAVVGYKASMPNLNSLDHHDAKIVLTPDSPSEFMARIITAHFNLKGLPKNYIEKADGSKAVYEKFLKANQTDKKAYVMWEPEVSKALELPGSHILLDSSKIKGHIVDVLVVQRKYLTQHPDVAKKVVEAYLRTAYHHRKNMVQVVLDDAQQLGSVLSQNQAERLVQGIIWKNTLENFAHYGLMDQSSSKGLDHLEDIIEKISEILIHTKAIKEDLLQGNYNSLFYDTILAELKRDNFHPGRKVNLLAEEMGILPDESIRGTIALPALNDYDWERLIPVGKLRVAPISFGRGKASIGFQSKRDLKQFAAKLKSWPNYYLVIVGHARKAGDPELNRILAMERAQAVKTFLINECQINPNRIKAKAAKVFKRGGGGQSVSFVLGQMPY